MKSPKTLIELLEDRLMLSAPPGLDASLNNAIAFAGQQLNLTIGTDLSNNTNLYPNYTNPNGTWVTNGPDDWTAGAFAGSLWEMYALTGNATWESDAEAWTAPLAVDANNVNDTFLDIYAPSLDSYQATGNQQAVQNIISAAAAKITTYNPIVGAFQTSWRASTSGNPDANFGVLIDQTMDLQEVLWAAQETGNTAWYNDAVTALTTVETYLVRPDGSTAQWAYFDGQTGQFIDNETFQGYSATSTWSRGQAWAIYSFTTAYRDTGRADFLATAEATANYFVDNLPSDDIPYWDFDAPGIPNTYRDTSAAAIAASGLLQLAGIDPNAANAAKYRSAAAGILSSLAGPNYLAQGSDSHGILLHGAGIVPYNPPEPDTSLVFGDYYFLEAVRLYLSTQSGAPAVSTFQVNDGSIQRAMVDSVTVAFNEPVTLAPGALTVNQLSPTDSAPTPMAFTSNSPDGGTTWLLSFNAPGDIGGSLPDGSYELLISPSDVSNAVDQPFAGAAPAFTFNRFYGDFLGQGLVNASDFSILASHFGTVVGGGPFWYLDYTGQGVVDAEDFIQLASRFGRTLPMPATAPQVAAASEVAAITLSPPPADVQSIASSYEPETARILAIQNRRSGESNLL